MKKDKWVWMPHAGHLIVGSDCRFHLNTYVGRYIVSTAGEYLPDDGVLKIFALSRGYKETLRSRGDAVRANFIKENGGYEEIGFGRRYETMVFPAIRAKNGCCPFTAKEWGGVDSDGYNNPEKAYKGHLKMCAKWAEK